MFSSHLKCYLISIIQVNVSDNYFADLDNTNYNMYTKGLILDDSVAVRNVSVGNVIEYKYTETIIFCIFYFQLRYIGRDVLGLPAVGIGQIHKTQADKLVTDLFT